uniref:Uncharacterized protein n=1 Tax=mine drainage metagenome TaxID=410659 RepID=E6PLP5_9ZZZZ
MAIPESDLEKMNGLLKNGSNISDIARKFKQYDYWEVYWSVSDYSLLGKKRSITNRLNKLKGNLTRAQRLEAVNEINVLVKEIYDLSKHNGKKLIDITKVISK